MIYVFGPRRSPTCRDCWDDLCTMNCGPSRGEIQREASQAPRDNVVQSRDPNSVLLPPGGSRADRMDNPPRRGENLPKQGRDWPGAHLAPPVRSTKGRRRQSKGEHTSGKSTPRLQGRAEQDRPKARRLTRAGGSDASSRDSARKRRSEESQPPTQESERLTHGKEPNHIPRRPKGRHHEGPAGLPRLREGWGCGAATAAQAPEAGSLMWRIVSRKPNRPHVYLRVPRDSNDLLGWVTSPGAATTFASKATALEFAHHFQSTNVNAKVERLGTHASTLKSPSALDGRSSPHSRGLRRRKPKSRARVRAERIAHLKAASGESPEGESGGL